MQSQQSVNMSSAPGHDADGAGASGSAVGDVGSMVEVVQVNDGEEKGDEGGQEKNGRKPIAPRSEMWQHFNKIMENNVVKKGQCKYCKRRIAADTTTNGTSAMRKHFNTCKLNPHKLNKDPKQGTLQAVDGQGVSTWRYDPELLRNSFAEMLIEDELPFVFGEKSGFRKFMAVACPRFEPPSRRTSTRDIIRIYFQKKAKLKHFLKENCDRVCLTTDCWTSQQQDSYMTVTAHFIDNDCYLHKKVISFFQVKGHKGDDIGKNLHRCLLEWGLDKVMTVTVDNASANDSGLSYLKKLLNNAKGTILGGKYLHMRCAAHIVNLIVQDGLKEVDISVKRVRGAVRYIKNGTTRLVKFKEIAEEEKVQTKTFLNLDICTRWNSTYLMLKAATAYEKVFARYLDEDPCYAIDLDVSNKGVGHPDESDWINAKKMADFLEHFYDLTNRISSSLHVTIHSFFFEIGEVHILIKNWMNSDDILQAEMGNKMKDKYNKYWGTWHENIENERRTGKGKEREKENMNLLIFVGAALDPRYKLSEYTKLAMEEMFGEEIGEKVWTAVQACVSELYDEYRTIYAPPDASPQVSNSQEPKGAQGGLMKTLIAKRLRLGSIASGNTKSELEKYLAEDTEDIDKKIDILAWWKVNSSRFPILARLARDVLAIPISTVASESTFSTSGRILDDFRTSLTPFTLQALVCTQDWKRRATPVDIQENMEQLAELEKELIEEYNEKGKSKRKIDESTSTSIPKKQASKSSKGSC